MAISSSVSWSSRKNGSSQSNGLASALMPLAALFIGTAVAMVTPVCLSRVLSGSAGRANCASGKRAEDLQIELAEGLGGTQLDRARPRQVDLEIGRDAARTVRHDHDAIGQEHRLGDGMGHEQDRLALFAGKVALAP